MDHYIFRAKDIERASTIIEGLRKNLKQRNLAMINMRLLELNDILLNAKKVQEN